MKKEKVAKKQKKSIFKWLILLAYIGCAVVILVEACIPGTNSANQSNAVGESISNILNDLSKDQTKYVELKKVEITNKIEKAYVGETHQVTTQLTPKNATHQSLTYFSSNEEIASISQTGLITFLKNGNVDIFVKSTFNPDLYDSFFVDVKDVLPTSIQASLPSANYDSLKNAYNLFVGKNYPIETTILPINTTNKTYSYLVSHPDVIHISNDTISVQRYNNLEPITITIISEADEKIAYSFNVIVDFEEITELTAVEFKEGNTSTLFVGNSKRLTPLFTPINASFTELSYESKNPNIATFINGVIKGISEGSTTIIAKSIRNNFIFVEHTVIVQPLPELKDFKISPVKDLVVGNSVRLSIIKNPTNAIVDNSLFTYLSNDPSIASVSSNGTIKGLKVGKCVITVTYNQTLSQSIEITITPKIDVSISGLNVSMSKTSFYKNETIQNFIQVDFLPANANIIDRTYEFVYMKKNDLDDSIKNIASNYNAADYIQYNAQTNELKTLNKEGYAYFKIYHPSSGVYSDLCQITIHEKLPNNLKMTVNGQPQNNNTLSTPIGATFLLSVMMDDQEATYKTLTWKFEELEGEDSARLELTQENNDLSRNLITTNEGKIKITISIITPILREQVSCSLQIFITHFDFDLFHITNQDNIIDNEKTLEIYKNSTLQLGIYTKQPYTRKLIEWKSSNSSVVAINTHGEMIAKQCGIAIITARNVYNDVSESISVKVLNKLALNTENTYTLSGNTIKHIKDNLYEFKNGNTIKLTINFADDATYRNVTYSSSNEKVATIGADGIISPVGLGETTITITYSDGYSIEKPFVITIKLKVLKQPLISNIKKFTAYIRKALGHFGVFFILGIFSLFTYLLFFKKKQWGYSIPIHFASGYLIAFISEVIQLYVPGRCGALRDVHIDYLGFILSSAFILIIIGLIYLIKYLIYICKKRKTEVS